MQENAASLDRLNDIVIPPPVGWWPLASGWYVVLGMVLVLCGWLSWRRWKLWRSNAYRRVALRELESARSVANISAILRRVALTWAPRAEIATLGGSEFADWIASHSPSPMPKSVRETLRFGAYTSDESDFSPLREYAATWIANHVPSK
ncbi:MAG: DUF4381 domain-containing protein [bacterium]|nr:DUF4381 domain-containing protein [bacterium]